MFWPRTVKGSFLSAWRLEAARLRRSNRRAWSIRNDLWTAWAMTAVLRGGLIGWLGWRAVPFLVVQAVFGFSLLEVVNYLEHYGLRRQKEANGRYDEADGHPREGFPPGTAWTEVPDDWPCPECAVREKSDFQPAG